MLIKCCWQLKGTITDFGCGKVMEAKYVSWWILWSGPGALGEEGKTGKRKQNVGLFKPFSLARHKWETGRRNDMYLPLSFTFSTLHSQVQLAASQYAPNDVRTSPHLTTTNLAPAMWLVHLNFPAVLLTLTNCWWPAGLFNMGHLPCPKTSGTHYLSIPCNVPEE
jgi:hypothetical protein